MDIDHFYFLGIDANLQSFEFLYYMIYQNNVLWHVLTF